MISEIVVLTYGIGYLPSARWLYGRWRVQQQERATHLQNSFFCNVNHDAYNRHHNCCYKDESNVNPTPNGELTLFAMFVGLFWPLIILVGFVRWNPPKAPSELRREIEERDTHIAELEVQLDMKKAREGNPED